MQGITFEFEQKKLQVTSHTPPTVDIAADITLENMLIKKTFQLLEVIHK